MVGRKQTHSLAPLWQLGHQNYYFIFILKDLDLIDIKFIE